MKLSYSFWNKILKLSLIPTMTSNTLPSGVASANVFSSTAYTAFNGTGWTATSSSGFTIVYQFPSPKRISKYYVTITGSANIGWGDIEGSNDGSSWTVISSTNPFISSPVSILSNTLPYSYYRLVFTGGVGSSISGLIWQLDGY
jgi:hypothetical protein